MKQNKTCCLSFPYRFVRHSVIHAACPVEHKEPGNQQDNRLQNPPQKELEPFPAKGVHNICQKPTRKKCLTQRTEHHSPFVCLETEIFPFESFYNFRCGQFAIA